MVTERAGFIDGRRPRRVSFSAFANRRGTFRGIAQSGSAPALGAGCREFESLYPDQIREISEIGPDSSVDRAVAF